MDADACFCGSVLSKLLCIEALCKRAPQRDLMRCMRCLYTLLLWASQRVEEQARARGRASPGRCRSRGPVWPVTLVLVTSPRCTAGPPPRHARTCERIQRCPLCRGSPVCTALLAATRMHALHSAPLTPRQDLGVLLTLVNEQLGDSRTCSLCSKFFAGRT